MCIIIVSKDIYYIVDTTVKLHGHNIPYSGKFSERNIFGNLNETEISEIKFRNVATCYYVVTELL